MPTYTNQCLQSTFRWPQLTCSQQWVSWTIISFKKFPISLVGDCHLVHNVGTAPKYSTPHYQSHTQIKLVWCLIIDDTCTTVVPPSSLVMRIALDLGTTTPDQPLPSRSPGVAAAHSCCRHTIMADDLMLWYHGGGFQAATYL